MTAQRHPGKQRNDGGLGRNAPCARGTQVGGKAMLRKSCVLLVLVALTVGVAFLARPASAAEERKDGDGEPAVRENRGDGEDRDRGDRRRRFGTLMRAFRKQRAGEKLTKEEQEAVDRMQRLRGRDGNRDGGRAGAPGRGPAVDLVAPPGQKPGIGALQRLKHDERLNVIDDAYYRIAEIHIHTKEYGKAVEALQQLLKTSPDKLAISLTHLNLAEIYRKELDNKKQAIAEYRKVTGEYAIDAQKRLASLFEELDQIDEAVDQFEAIIKATPDKMQKVLALRELAELLFRNEREDEAVGVLQRLTKAVTYDEAKEVSKALVVIRAQREEAEESRRGREREARTRAWRDRFGGRRRRRPAADRGVRPEQGRPVERKIDDPQPEERPIEPKPR